MLECGGPGVLKQTVRGVGKRRFGGNAVVREAVRAVVEEALPSAVWEDS